MFLQASELQESVPLELPQSQVDSVAVEPSPAQVAPPAAPPAVAPAPPAAPQRVSHRTTRKRERFGDNGELDGPASAFKTAPVALKAPVSLSDEVSVPGFAMPGAELWAMGLYAGTRKRFKATVVKLRTQFPRIVVKYTADENGNINPLALPDPNVAYLLASDVAAFDV